MQTIPRRRIQSTLLAAVAAMLVPLKSAADSASLSIARRDKMSQVAQDPAIISQRVSTFVADALKTLKDDTSEPTITVGRPRTAHLSACDNPQPFLSSGAHWRSSLSVGVRCISPQSWTTYVPVGISMTVSYLVAKRAIEVGHAMQPEDIHERKVPLDRLPTDALRKGDQLFGKMASRRIAMGQPIRSSSLRSENAILRGQKVRLTARGPGFSVKSEGQALTSGAPGAAIQIRMPSGQVITGVVAAAGTVEVAM